MMVWERASLMLGLKPVERAPSRPHEKMLPRSAMPNSRYISAYRHRVTLKDTLLSLSSSVSVSRAPPPDPGVFALGESGHVVAAHPLGKAASLFFRNLDDDPAGDGVGAFPPDFLLECTNHGAENQRLYAAAIQDAHVIDV